MKNVITRRLNLNLADSVDYIVDYYDGENDQCLIEFSGSTMVAKHTPNAPYSMIFCDIAELPQFITLPGITQILIDTHDGFMVLWNHEPNHLVWETDDGYKFQWVQMSETYGQWHDFNVEETDMFFEGTIEGPQDHNGDLLSGRIID